MVLTHGEPHGGNFLRAGDHLMLIDWDTVGLAVPERDLWMLDDGTPDALRAYTERTGRRIDTDAIDLYRLTWTLADLAAYGAVLRSSAEETADVQKALSAFTSYL
jgi:spectinomycin phosphotransferase